MGISALGIAGFQKRFLDLCVAVPSLMLISPLVWLITLLVRTKLGSPVLFSQVRPGLHNKPFRIYKFRTMSNAKDKLGNLLPDAKRLTRLGHILRATSLDELPELWNVRMHDLRGGPAGRL